ncbi:hypothetical protein [Pararhizobium haloflavum]|uniref:hypothetical protein n=1 Tax=Pararhizobium haloflavum TaxID=2037914 RepID=UPI000C176B52|nr:hypothetical protein [Pararhizobium haloflavum]
MFRLLTLALMACLSIGIADACVTRSGADKMMKKDHKSAPATAQPARPPVEAVREEFEALRASPSAERCELFLARHPDSVFADEARKLCSAARSQEQSR